MEHKKYDRTKSISVNTVSPLSNEDLRDLLEFRSRGMNDPRFEMAIHQELPRLVTASEALIRVLGLIEENASNTSISIEELRKVIRG